MNDATVRPPCAAVVVVVVLVAAAAVPVVVGSTAAVDPGRAAGGAAASMGAAAVCVVSPLPSDVEEKAAAITAGEVAMRSGGARRGTWCRRGRTCQASVHAACRATRPLSAGKSACGSPWCPLGGPAGCHRRPGRASRSDTQGARRPRRRDVGAADSDAPF
jgi:hypothetical protein